MNPNEALAQPEALAREIAAIANTDGGVFSFPRRPSYEPLFEDALLVRDALQKVQEHLDPVPTTVVEEQAVGGEHLLWVRVSPSPELVLSDGSAYTRDPRGDTRAMQPHEILGKVSTGPSEKQLKRLAQAITKLTQKNDQLLRELEEARTIKAKALDSIQTFIIGLILGWAFNGVGGWILLLTRRLYRFIVEGWHLLASLT
jgi:hypothetical protein